MIALDQLWLPWEPVGDPVVVADASSAVTITPPAGTDGIVIWTETQDIRMYVLPKGSSAVPTAANGIPIATTDGRLFVPLHNAIAKIIEQVAGADVQYFFIHFLEKRNG